LIAKVYQVDPLVCAKCGKRMSIVGFTTDAAAIGKILDHLGLSAPEVEKPLHRHESSCASPSRATAGACRRGGSELRRGSRRRPAGSFPARVLTVGGVLVQEVPGTGPLR
jgi:hypothetical protein